MISELRDQLEQVALRFRHRRVGASMAMCWLIMVLIDMACLTWPWLRDYHKGFNIFLPSGFASTMVLSGLCIFLSRRLAVSPRSMARRIEAKYPDLRAGLITAFEHIDEFDSDWRAGGVNPLPAQRKGTGGSRPPLAKRMGYLESSVVREAVAHSKSHDWDEVVPTWTLRLSQFAALASLLLLCVTEAEFSNQLRKDGVRGTSESLAATGSMNIQVDPGNAEIEKGSPLLVVARFEGVVPPEASLVLGDGKSGAEPARTMTRSLEDPTFAARVESIDSDLSYRVDYAGRASETYRVKVFEYPAVRRTDARLVYPQYTSLDAKTIEDIRHVTLLEGTELTLMFRLNKPIASARLVDPEGKTTALKASPELGPLVQQTTFTPTDSTRYKVQLTDQEGRSNKQTFEIAVHVTRNNAPIVKTIQPSRDVRVSPVEELALKAQVEDDFGITRQGLSYSFGGAEPKEIELKGEPIEDRGKAKDPSKSAVHGKTAKPDLNHRRLKTEYLLDFEALKAVPDQLVTYFFWAEDVGSDGKPRRTDGDMFFAEVRHFEEIFRQGEQPSGSAEMEMQGQGQGQNAQQSDKLAELQKEIINGTWKLIRREIGSKPTEAFGADAKVLQEAERSAIEQAGELEGRLRDEKSKASLAIAIKAMREAEVQLSEAAKGTATTSLRPALAAEQSAYQALLKLRAREFEVIRGNRRQRGQGGGGGGASQQQLNQLDLNDEQNNYEEQRSARARQENLTKQQQEQRESRQVLSRLRELAQRQADLNARLKELQSALESAKEQQAKAEIERQLKRLREQQQEILRDTDELRERMENEQNRQRMAEAREELEQGREHVRQAAEALEKGALPQAVTEGARAGQKLNQIKEEMRKDTANRFSEQVTEMRDQARQLDERQEKLSQQLEAQEKTVRRSLRGSDERKQTRQELEQQRKQLEQILNRMRETVTEAEETEPRLAEELFDTINKANERMLPETLEETDRLVDMGIGDEAAKSSRRAGEGLGELRKGIERASRGVLGDEAAALRLAQRELKDLADQVDREIAQGYGRPDQPSPEGQPRRNQRERPNTDRAETARGQLGEPRGEGQRSGDGEPNGQAGRGQREGEPNGEGEEGQQSPNGGRGRQPGQQQGQRGEQQQREGQVSQGQQQGQGQQGQGQQGQRGRLRGGSSLRGGGPADPRPDNGGPGGQAAGLDRFVDGLDRGGLPGWGPAEGPITGEGFRQWVERMRDVEELLEDAQLRAEAARIRDRVRGSREDYKRHSKAPDWTKLQDLVANPLNELRKRIADEVRRKESPDSLVPIDRDPVPPQFAEGVRRYYERLGSGQ